MNNRLHAIALQLKKYPDPPPNPEMEVIKSLTEFSGKVKDRVLQQDFMSQWDNNYAEPFKKRIIAMKPKFIVKEPVIITLDLDSPSSTPTQRKRNLPEDTQATPSKRGRGLPANGANGAVKLEPQDRLGVSTPSSRLGFQNQGLTTPMSSPSRGPRSKTLMELRQIIQRSAVPGQPGLVSASVYEPLYTEAAMTWGGHLQTFISETFMFLENEIMYILEGAFFHLKNRAVYRESVEHMKAFMESHKKELTDQLNLIYNLEAHRLFTKDEDALERNKAAEKKVLQRHRHLLRWSARMGESIGPIRKMEELTEEELAQENIRMQKELVKLGPDPFEPEVNVAAYVRGYYLTAASRFIDVACIHVMSGLLPRIARVIDTYLYEKLGFGGQYSSELTLKYFYDFARLREYCANTSSPSSPRRNSQPSHGRRPGNGPEAQRVTRRERASRSGHGNHHQPRAQGADSGAERQPLLRDVPHARRQLERNLCPLAHLGYGATPFHSTYGHRRGLSSFHSTLCVISLFISL